MPILAVAVNYGIALLCAIHAVRTGRNMYWIFIVLVFPLLGSLVYIIAEVLPEFSRSPQAHKAGQAARRALDPGREAREALLRLDVARTSANLRRAADALLEQGRKQEALALYEEMAAGPDGEEPAVLSALARGKFDCGDPQGALDALDRLKKANPSYRNAEAHLLYARALEALGRTGEALKEYEALAAYYPGAEARARWAMLLEKLGRRDEAKERWREILAGARIAPAFARRAQKIWIDMARARVG